MANWSTVNKERHYWRYRVHVEHWDGYVNRYYDSLEEAKAYQERMLAKEYVEHATLSKVEVE